LTAAISAERLLKTSTHRSAEAVTATAGLLAIVAGAGSGKTRASAAARRYAIETGRGPSDQILLVTFRTKPRARWWRGWRRSATAA